MDNNIRFTATGTSARASILGANASSITRADQTGATAAVFQIALNTGRAREIVGITVNRIMGLVLARARDGAMPDRRADSSPIHLYTPTR